MRASRPPLVAATALAAVIGLLAAALVSVIHLQARAARRVIGKPLGQSAPVVREVYKRKYGDPIELLLLGDSIAAGLGAGSPDETLGAQLARRLAKKTRRTVRLRSAAHVGSETSMVRAQLASLPPGYRADVAVIVVGGNDVTHRVRPAESVRHLREVLEPLRGGRDRGRRREPAPTSVRWAPCPSRCAPSPAAPRANSQRRSASW